MRVLHAMLALSCAAAIGGADAAGDDPLVFVTVSYDDRAGLQAIASRFQHVIVDARARTVRVEATSGELAALRRDGIDAAVDQAATARMRRTEHALRDGARPASIDGFPCYRTVEETTATMDALAAAHPNLARVVDLGPTWLRSIDPGAGDRMRALRITQASTDAAVPDKADMVVVASIHAREYTPAELLTRFGEWLVTGYGVDDEATWLLDNFRFHLVLHGNPDGRRRAEAGLSWRKNVNDSNGSCPADADGIDLNRNFPYFWNASSGSSGNPCAGTYRGPREASEPETANLLHYVAGLPDEDGIYRGGVLPDRRGDAVAGAAPDDYRGLFLDLHSYSRLVLWPWSHTTAPTANAGALRTLGRRLARLNGYSPRQWTGLYVADGTTTDTVYGLLGAPSYTIELGHAFFESCATFESSTLPRNLAALRYAARTLRAPYRYPSGPTTTVLSLSPRRVARGVPVQVEATVDDAGFAQGSGDAEPVHPIAFAHAYLNRAPWAGYSGSTAMRAVDGAFDEPAERVAATLPTSGLAIGRHAVAVRATNTDGRPGTAKAAYFTIAGSRSFANAVPVPIRDASTIESPIAVDGIAGTGPAALEIGIDIAHPRIGDLHVALVAPGGTTYPLHRRSGGNADRILHTYVRDASSEHAGGTWRLRVADAVSGSEGRLNGWTLTMRY